MSVLTKKVSILILTYNRLELTQEYVPQIVDKIGDIDAEIIIWDNFSNDGTYDWLCEYSRADCRISQVYANDKNIGMEAINTMAALAKGEFILKIDDDVVAPKNFAQRLVGAFEEVNEDKLLYLAWDMLWGGTTFATRSGKRMYRPPEGIVLYPKKTGGEVFVSYYPDKWMVNGVCRLCRRDRFLALGGHPKGVVYGVDYAVSKKASKEGYWIGFYHTHDPIEHKGTIDSQEYRILKNKELEKTGSPLHV